MRQVNRPRRASGVTSPTYVGQTAAKTPTARPLTTFPAKKSAFVVETTSIDTEPNEMQRTAMIVFLRPIRSAKNPAVKAPIAVLSSFSLHLSKFIIGVIAYDATGPPLNAACHFAGRT